MITFSILPRSQIPPFLGGTEGCAAGRTFSYKLPAVKPKGIHTVNREA
jgi:hypothetical protein